MFNNRAIKNLHEEIKINVFQSIIKTSKLELIVEKLTEIGISSFTPIVTERTQRKDIDSLSENKLKRLKKYQLNLLNSLEKFLYLL